MFEQLSNQFSTIINRLQGYKYLSTDHIDTALVEIKTALIEADVALSVIDKFSEGNQEAKQQIFISIKI